jgi:curved DNA-binding protein CbpA
VVAKAFGVLSDSNKRAIHDEGGDAEMNRGRSSGYQPYQRNGTYNRRGEEVSPEDLFNMFFGGTTAFRPQRHRQQQQRRHYQQEDDIGLGGLTQMMPIVLLILLAIFALLFSVENEPLYTFYPSTSNTQLRNTKTNHINYYVNPKSFDTQMQNNVLKIKRTERQIESDWLHELRVACQSEQRLRANLLTQADGLMFGIGRNERAYKKAKDMKLEKCDELRRLAPKLRNT